MKTILSSAIVAATCLALPSLASAQDDRWTPWLGCWTRVTEGVRQGTGVTQATALSPVDPVETPVAAPRSCIVRSGDGVSVTIAVPGEPPTVQTFLADGSSRQIDEGDCRGVERRDWSQNGRRLFLKADVTCGTELPRAVTGMGLITNRGEWLDIRSFRQNDIDLTTVTRYRRVEGTIYESTRLTLDEVIEASTKVAAPVVEAAIAESRSRIPANRKTLIALDDANVPSTVIDVVVAMAYPEKFIVESPAPSVSSSSSQRSAVSSSGYYPDYYYNPIGYSYYGMFYEPYYPYYPSYPPGYYPIGGPPIYGGGGGGSGGGDVELPARGGARAINGLGYTRIREVEAAPVGRSTSSGSANSSSGNSGGSSGGVMSSASSDGGSSSSGSSSSSSSSGGGGGGGGASPQGYSGGGDGGGGRTAQPR